MSTTMDQIHSIRDMFYQQDKNISEISSATGLNWKTVKKYVDMEDFNVIPANAVKKECHESKLDPFKHLIDQWLTDDKKAPRKQRHTAKRVFRRLQKEAPGFNCSYRLVADYVAKKKKELHSDNKDGFLPLIHRTGEAQADFGTAAFYENGRYIEHGKYLVLSFPHSNGGYLQLFRGENIECLLEGLTAIFNHIGGVPTEIWFDNTRTIVTEIIKGGSRNVTEKFQRFCEHFRFKPVFMNPDSGYEKGNVENKVGYLRRNELVPVPEFRNLAEKNKELLICCDEDMKREHYDIGKNDLISELFEEDRKSLIQLPDVSFETASYKSVLTDKYGRFTLDKGKHRYSSSPEQCQETVTVKLTAEIVTVYDSDMHEIITHRRLYGDEFESMEWVPYLRFIARRPRSLKNTGIYDMMPEAMQEYMDRCESSERGKVLKVLAELTELGGFEKALETVKNAISYNASDPESLKSLYNRIYSEVPLLPPLEQNEMIPELLVIPFRNDFMKLDSVLKGGAARG